MPKLKSWPKPKPLSGCSVPLCDGKIFATGLCSRHYQANRKYGDPTVVLQKQHHGKTAAERFWIYAKRGPDCWDWTGSKDAKGYGRLNIGGAPELAHRIAYVVTYGDIPDGMGVLHKCDNPRCINPEHLFLGTPLDNVRDMHAKGRARKRGLKGAEHNLAKLTEADVRAIRASSEAGTVLGARYGVSKTQISSIRNRKSWSHVTD